MAEVTTHSDLQPFIPAVQRLDEQLDALIKAMTTTTPSVLDDPDTVDVDESAAGITTANVSTAGAIEIQYAMQQLGITTDAAASIAKALTDTTKSTFNKI
ncbi:MAG: hypothetical protein Q8N17_23885 [Burkholderiaceae bacterium]|nr:hypothetical protein [Burkholderiaceae bacterium]